MIAHITWNSLVGCVIDESDGLGVTLVTYLRTPELFGSLLSENRSGVSSFYHQDDIGATRLLTNSAAVVTDTFLFDAWGQLVVHSGSNNTPYGWGGDVGYRTDGASGTIVARQRSYSTGQGAWLSVDPLTSAVAGFGVAGINPYGYCGNHPVSLLDPTGLEGDLTRSGMTLPTFGPTAHFPLSSVDEVLNPKGMYDFYQSLGGYGLSEDVLGEWATRSREIAERARADEAKRKRLEAKEAEEIRKIVKAQMDAISAARRAAQEKANQERINRLMADEAERNRGKFGPAAGGKRGVEAEYAMEDFAIGNPNFRLVPFIRGGVHNGR